VILAPKIRDSDLATDLFVYSNILPTNSVASRICLEYTQITRLGEAKPSRNVNKVPFSHLPFRLILLLQFRYASVSYITQQYYYGEILITIHAFLLSSRNWTDPKISIHYIEHRLATFKQYIQRDSWVLCKQDMYPKMCLKMML